jgi:hypothetical protein
MGIWASLSYLMALAITALVVLSWGQTIDHSVGSSTTRAVGKAVLGSNVHLVPLDPLSHGGVRRRAAGEPVASSPEDLGHTTSGPSGVTREEPAEASSSRPGVLESNPSNSTVAKEFVDFIKDLGAEGKKLKKLCPGM